ncbi:glutamate-5-semialdehyde dehydrogenase [Acutalibacter sp. 1XD8-36]|uniref:glutamate-5-semialdehyde dehydrogenase n=1 Tax=Acutalibacter sp. 1XD8-36 TaxID=2320852 RepID=UPI001411BA0C|nr:glutamate-5-semialdehyde dehydrogenase [Acutalibacter sp. 1XD8-36]NBJ88072.1 glutamate-5-semialdehyde dehydrogenase [Acutalibacter sp. 1XD8-36]
MTKLEAQCAAAKRAAYILSTAETSKKNMVLETMAETLTKQQERWLMANENDLAAAKECGMRSSLLDRLTLTPERIAGVVDSLRQVAALPDPIGEVDRMETRPNGLIIGRRRVPLGVVAMVYEARPNVTVDAAALCLKSGNACVLRGGSEAINSNRAAVEIMREVLVGAELPEDSISLVQDTDRETVNELMHLNQYIDVLIPRGGAGLIRAVTKNSSVPVIRTGEGVCHVYIDREADLDMGAAILENAKCSRPSVCNAAECVVIHREAAEEFLSKAVPLLDKHNVELRCDSEALAILDCRGVPAYDSDWDTEYGDYTLAVKIVGSVQEAIEFINAHSTGHSESIITNNHSTAKHFLDLVDAAAVYVNASTRFTDGGEFGLGAEIGISTQKMHARGPLGLEELTSSKYVVYGQGQVR